MSAEENLTLQDLTPDPGNAREHTERNVGMISRCDYKHWTTEQVARWWDGERWRPNQPQVAATAEALTA